MVRIQPTNFQNPVLGHPAGLFVVLLKCGNDFLIMECVLTCFVLTSSLAKGGWSWVLKMPWLCMELILCGFISSRNWRFLADRYLGYRWAVVLGALAMTLGHRWQSKQPLFYILELAYYWRMVCLNLI
jgi:POT family proton-dependent oligopeptide transporter